MTTLVQWLEGEVRAGDTDVQVWVDRARAAEKELKDTRAKLAAAVKMQEGYYKENKQLKRRADLAELKIATALRELERASDVRVNRTSIIGNVHLILQGKDV